ncbi:MAG: oxidoreductase [Gordonia sp. (in: high G+C Gram-positive bacteria)]
MTLAPRWLTPHRAVLLGLLALTLSAFAAAEIDADFAYRPADLAASLVVALVVSWAVSALGAAAVRVPPGADSWAITALILFFVLPAGTGTAALATVAIGTAAAAASKYVLAWRRRLIVNPAVAGAVVAYALAYAGVTVGGETLSYPSWWIAAKPLLWPMVVIGVLVVTAIARWPMVLVFLAAALVTIGVVSGYGDGALSTWLISSPMFFAAAIMLPEPLTSPASRLPRTVYAAGVGVLMYWQQSWEISDAYTLEFVPEIALLVGCLFAFAVRVGTGRAARPHLVVRDVAPVAEHSWTVALDGERRHHFAPGQWATLSAPSWRSPLWHRTRRVFSYVSSPAADDVEFAFTAVDPVSDYKSALIEGRTTRLYVDDRGGDFVLPKHGSAPLVLLASGIGITPMISMLRSVDDDVLARCTVVHVVRSAHREAFDDDFAAARAAGARVRVLHGPELSGGFGASQLAEHLDVPSGAHYYVSGSPAFVRRTTAAIRRLDPAGGWNPLRLHRDSFVGY